MLLRKPWLECILFQEEEPGDFMRVQMIHRTR